MLFLKQGLTHYVDQADLRHKEIHLSASQPLGALHYNLHTAMMEVHKLNLAPQPMAERKGGHGIQVLEGDAASPPPSAFQRHEVRSILYCSSHCELVPAQTKQSHPEMAEGKSQNKPSSMGDVGVWGASVSLDCISWSSKSETRRRKKST